MANLPTVAQLVSEHPLVAGFLAGCGQQKLSGRQILYKMAAVSQHSPELADAFERALGSQFCKQAGFWDVVQSGGKALYNATGGAVRAAAGSALSGSLLPQSTALRGLEAIGAVPATAGGNTIDAVRGVGNDMAAAGFGMLGQAGQNLVGGGLPLDYPQHPANVFTSKTDDLWQSGKPDLFTRVGQPLQSAAMTASDVASSSLPTAGLGAGLTSAGNAVQGASALGRPIAKGLGAVLSGAGNTATSLASTAPLGAAVGGTAAAYQASQPQPGQQPLSPEAAAATGVGPQPGAEPPGAVPDGQAGPAPPPGYEGAAGQILPDSTAAASEPNPAVLDARQNLLGGQQGIGGPDALPEGLMNAMQARAASLPAEAKAALAAGELTSQQHGENLGALKAAHPDWSIDGLMQAYSNMSPTQKAMLWLGGGTAILGLLNFATGEDAGIESLLPVVLGGGLAAGAAGSAGMFGQGSQDTISGLVNQGKSWLGMTTPPSPDQAPKEQATNPNVPQGGQVSPAMEQELAGLPQRHGWLAQHTGAGQPGVFDQPDAVQLATTYAKQGPQAVGATNAQIQQLLSGLSPDAKQLISQELQKYTSQVNTPGADWWYPGLRNRYQQMQQAVRS